jgi:hypothetical protein
MLVLRRCDLLLIATRVGFDMMISNMVWSFSWGHFDGVSDF